MDARKGGRVMFDGFSFSLLFPASLGLCALVMWVAMLFMFKPEARVQFREEAIVLKVSNAKILRIERHRDEVIVHVDREVAQTFEALAA
jgi:hypothetical protein